MGSYFSSETQNHLYNENKKLEPTTEKKIDFKHEKLLEAYGVRKNFKLIVDNLEQGYFKMLTEKNNKWNKNISNDKCKDVELLIEKLNTIQFLPTPILFDRNTKRCHCNGATSVSFCTIGFDLNVKSKHDNPLSEEFLLEHYLC